MASWSRHWGGCSRWKPQALAPPGPHGSSSPAHLTIQGNGSPPGPGSPLGSQDPDQGGGVARQQPSLQPPAFYGLHATLCGLGVISRAWFQTWSAASGAGPGVWLRASQPAKHWDTLLPTSSGACVHLGSPSRTLFPHQPALRSCCIGSRDIPEGGYWELDTPRLPQEP